MAARNISKSRRVYEALTHLMIPWSSGRSSEVVFGGKNTTWTFSSSTLMDWGWPGALSIICKILMATLPSPNIPWLQGWSIGGTIQWTTLPWHMLWGYFARMLAGFFFLSPESEDSLHGKRHAWSRPAKLLYSTSVSLSIHALSPGTCFALLWI